MTTLAQRVVRYRELDAKRTQGGWEHEGMFVTCNSDCPYHPIADCSENHTCKTDEEFEANAQFIASAPAMFQDLLTVIEENERLCKFIKELEVLAIGRDNSGLLGKILAHGIICNAKQSTGGGE